MLGEPFLARKAKIVVPRITEKKRVHRLGVGGELGVTQNKIRKLGEAIPRDWIRGVESHVLLNLFEIGADVLHRLIIVPRHGGQLGISTAAKICTCHDWL
jgi:hypothetical protein